jgi:hypothetical protein
MRYCKENEQETGGEATLNAEDDLQSISSQLCYIGSKEVVVPLPPVAP